MAIMGENSVRMLTMERANWRQNSGKALQALELNFEMLKHFSPETNKQVLYPVGSPLSTS